jgi:predicted membrane protein (TIGR00267 family)
MAATSEQQVAVSAQTMYLRDWIYGGMDGTVTTFAVAAGAAGADLSPSIVIVMGLANLFADGFSMAAGNFVSSRAERDNAERLLASEQADSGSRPTLPREKALAVRSPLTAALCTFLAFAAFGLVPLIPYLASGGFAASIVATAITFFVIGAAKSRWSLQPAWKSGLETLAIGGSAAVLAFVTGHFLARWFT